MRTLKKTLCLVLALVMMLGLCAINVGATAFTDDAQIGANYQEAVEVASALGVINGKGDGSTFDPKGTLTRVQGCYLITYLLKADAGATATRFNDVNREDVAVVEWMASKGITDGRDDVTFDPSSTMKGMEFAKWLLTSLGYDAEKENLTGPDWEGGVRLLTAKTGLSRGIEGYNQNEPITREEAAQMVLNALEATMVEYRTGTTVVGDNVNVTIGGTYTDMPNGTGKDYSDETDNNNVRLNTMQLCELYHAKLKKEVSDGGVSEYDLNRPMTHTWKLGGEELYRVVATPVAAFGKKVEDKDVTSALSGYYVTGTVTEKLTINSRTRTNSDGKTGDDFIVVNGAAIDLFDKSNEDGDNLYKVNSDGAIEFGSDGISMIDLIKDLTANGRSVEIYATDDEDPFEITQIVVNCFTVAKVDDIETNNKGVTTYTFTKANSSGTLDVEAETYADSPKDDTLVIGGESLAKGDIVLLTCNGGALPAEADADNLVYAYPTEMKTGEQTRYTNKGKVTIDGTVYDVATGVAHSRTYKANTLSQDAAFTSNVEVDYYLFNLGGVDYLVHVKAVDKDDSTGNYAFIVNASGELKNNGFDAGTPEIKVRAVLSDGTWGDYKVATEKVTASGAKESKINRYAPKNAEGVYQLIDASSSGFTSNYTIIKNTDIIIAGGDNKVTWGTQPESEITIDNAAKMLMGDLYGYVYEYSLDGDVITLKPLGEKKTDMKNSSNAGDNSGRFGDNYTSGDKTKGTIYTGQTMTAVTKGVQNYTPAKFAVQGTAAVGTNGTYGLPAVTAGVAAEDGIVAIGSSTKFIIFNSDSEKKEVKVQTGLSNLSSDPDNSTYGYYVAKATSADRLTADIVFMVKSGGVKGDTVASKDYIFINASTKTTEKNGDDKIVVFQAWNTKGESVRAFAKEDNASSVKTGLYYLKDGEIDKKLLDVDEGSNTDPVWTGISKDTPYFYLEKGTANVVDNTWIDSDDIDVDGSDNHYWTIGGVKSSNDKNADLTKKDLFVILETNSTGLTENIAYIFTV